MDRERGWFRSSFTDQPGGQCVEVRSHDGTVDVRDSKNRDRGMLSFPSSAFAALVQGVKAGEFD